MPFCWNSLILPACGTPPQRWPAVSSPARKEIPLHPRATPSTADSRWASHLQSGQPHGGEGDTGCSGLGEPNTHTEGHQQSPSTAAPEHRPTSPITNPGVDGSWKILKPARSSFQMQTQTPACLTESQIKGGNEKKDEEETRSST